jgi:type I restriction enzyme M protein
MKFPERFHTFMPESGKKADLMFVQHMVASLKSDGRMAVVMPHGVLFRGGEEKVCRQKFIKDGILEAVIGLPAGLFYGTGIPACVLVINRYDSAKRKSVLFINADREYKEGKNQNSLRPEDIEKITHVYRNRLSVPKYSREVPVEELEREEFNLNIRRYVDNSPPPEPHDVRAHLHGGIPLSEITQLTSYFDNYAGLRSLLFKDRVSKKNDTRYSDFAAGVGSKENIKSLVESAPGLQAKHAEFHKSLDVWWKGNVKRLEKLPETQNVFEFRRQCIDGLSKALISHQLLDVYQARGAVAAYIKSLESDLKSIAASGWGPELIPDDEILQSQFPEVLEQIEKEQARIAELEGLFAAVSGGEEDEGEVEVDDESGVLPKSLVKSLKEEKKNLGGEIKEAKKRIKQMRKDADQLGPGRAANELRTEASDIEVEVLDKYQRIEEIDAQLSRHVALESEMKNLKSQIREVEKQKDEMIAAARGKITEAEAKKLILARFKRLLTEQFDGYLRQYQRAFIAAVENLWSKYAVTTKQILAERDREAAELDAFLTELGYNR